MATLALVGCGEGLTPTSDIQQVSSDVSALSMVPDAASTIAFQTFTDDVGSQAGTLTRTLLRSANAYGSFFGHAPPAAVDFSQEWVMFYAAGSQPNGGYQASFQTLLRAGGSLIAVTQLASPCVLGNGSSSPYALIKFAAQPGSSAQFYKNDGTLSCGNPPPVDPCAAMTCAGGTHCDSGKCVSDGVACGGLAGGPCPGSGMCVDDPYDGCDAGAGAVDCPGICQCVQNVKCAADQVFNGDPSVCACVAAPPDPCAITSCPSGTRCDSGKCVSDGVSCGGLAGKLCPGSGQCVDDPYDGCDPAAGGADCPGICQCVQNAACPSGDVFNSDPSVCACVSIPAPCPTEKCPAPAPAVANGVCSGGGISGPVCMPDSTGACVWSVINCAGS